MEEAGVGGAWPAILGHDSGREEGEKEQGGPWGRSPAAARPEAVRGGLATAAGGQRAAESVGVALQSLLASRTWGKRGREPRGLYCLPWFGLGCSGEGSSAVAGGGNGERRCWDLGRGPCGDGGGLWSSAVRGEAYLKAWQGGGGLAGRGRRPASGAAALMASRRGGASGEVAQR